MKKALEVDDGDGRTTKCEHLRPLNRAFRNGRIRGRGCGTVVSHHLGRLHPLSEVPSPLLIQLPANVPGKQQVTVWPEFLGVFHPRGRRRESLAPGFILARCGLFQAPGE